MVDLYSKLVNFLRILRTKSKTMIASGSYFMALFGSAIMQNVQCSFMRTLQSGKNYTLAARETNVSQQKGGPIEVLL